MGSWSHTSFGNDDALDWLAEFLGNPSLAALEAPIAVIADAPVDSYVEAPECATAVSACEVVAALGGRAAEKSLPELAEWLASKPQLGISDALILLALSALSRVRARSELNDLWSESDDFSKWQQALDDLVARLSTR